MGFASLLTIPLGMLGYIGMMKDYQIRSKTYAKAQNDMNSTLVEYVNGIEVIKAFNQSTASYEKFSNAIDFFHNSTLSWWKQSWFWSAFIQAVTPSTLLGTLPVGAYLYMNGQITLSNFIVCIILPTFFLILIFSVL
ncbi:ABC transporter transmembrane domain-containing protein [Treponema denticola]|uniref:ABC transporter transmembrane domain-containing protein n=1 Tax=Treponema denticola TaxID=158 RepID=UPI0021034E4A|nr:ABC transporter transmembrane domain-containing protein [Treponema denticola]